MSMQEMQQRIQEAACSIEQLENFLKQTRHLEVLPAVKAADVLLRAAKLIHEHAVDSMNEALTSKEQTSEEIASTVIEILLPEIDDMIEKISNKFVGSPFLTV